MIEILGPLVIALGSICFIFSASLDHLISPPKEKLEDIEGLEKDYVSMVLSRLFKLTKAESFNEPYWIESFRKYYHKNIKELSIAEHHLSSVSVNIKHMKMGIIAFGIILIVLGTMYTSTINLEVSENPGDLILVADTALVFFLGAEIVFSISCLRKYKHHTRQLTEILKSQRLVLGGAFMFRGGSSEESE